MITEAELRLFVEVGAVTIDTPLTGAQIHAASAVFDRLMPFRAPKEGEAASYRVGAAFPFDEPALLEILQHPFFEEVAKRVLGTEDARFFQAALVTSYPQPNTPFGFGQHVDIQYRLSDIHAVPGA